LAFIIRIDQDARSPECQSPLSSFVCRRTTIRNFNLCNR